MSKNKELLKQTGLYSISTIGTQLITAVSAVLTRRFLGPTQMGIWSTLQILVDYSKYTSLGVMSAVAVEIPYAVGKGDHEKSENIQHAAFTFVLVSAAAFSGLVMLFAFFTRNRFLPQIGNGLLLVTAVIFLQRISNFLITLLRCYKKFSIESGQMLWSSLVNAVLIVLFSYPFKLYGFILALSLSYVFNIVYVCMKFPFNFRWSFDRPLLRRLTIFGFPLMIQGIMTVIFRSMDRVMIAKMLGFTDLGLYSIALMACAYAGNFYSAVAVVFLPHFQEKFGEKDNPRDLEKYIAKSSIGFCLVMPAFFSVIWIAAPYIIFIFLPKFIEGILAMKILSLSVFFIAVHHPYLNFLITVKRHMSLFPVLGFSILWAAVTNFGAIRLGYGINGVAAATTVAFFMHFAVLFFTSFRYFTDLRSALTKFLFYMGLFVYSVLTLMLNTLWLFPNDFSLTHAVCRTLILVCTYVPLLFILNREFSVSSLLRKKMRGRFAPAN